LEVFYSKSTAPNYPFIGGLIGIFSKQFILLLLLLLFIISIKDIVFIFHYSYKQISKLFTKALSDLPTITFGIITLIIISTLYLAALQPPKAYDELAYHLPQVRQIIESQKIELDFGGHYFYGNIPKLMETSFAWSATIWNYSLSHLINLSIFLSFLLIIFGIIYKKFTLRAASLAVLFLVMFDNLTRNAITGYIDTATLSFEIGSLFLMLSYLTEKRRKGIMLFLAGCLMGLALASKYSPIPTLLYMFIIFTIFNFKQLNTKFIKSISIFIFGIFIFGSFWYLKNLFLFLNPFYPLYFGHKGVNNSTYLLLINAIQQFKPKTINSFFELIGRYKTINGAHVYISFFIPFLGLVFKKERKFLFPLIFFFISYTFYWFFYATHQIRFLAPAITVALIISAVIISKLKKRMLILSIFIISIYLLMHKPLWNSFWNTKFHLVERQYALGNITKTDFLIRNFGCQYQIIKYLEDNHLNGGVIDNWSVWHAPNVSFYATKNKFLILSYPSNKSRVELLHYLKQNNINYIYFNNDTKRAYLENKKPQVIKSKQIKEPIEKYLLSISDLVTSIGKCRLYKIRIPE